MRGCPHVVEPQQPEGSEEVEDEDGAPAEEEEDHDQHQHVNDLWAVIRDTFYFIRREFGKP